MSSNVNVNVRMVEQNAVINNDTFCVCHPWEEDMTRPKTKVGLLCLCFYYVLHTHPLSFKIYNKIFSLFFFAYVIMLLYSICKV